MKKRADKLSSVVFSILVVMIVLLAISNYLASGLYARYLSVGNATDDARVAKWEISFKDENGDVLDSSIPSVHLENGSVGEWCLDIVNTSETTAAISDDSYIKLRLYSPNFDVDHNHNTWDFLEDNEHHAINNPINFKVYLYNCSISDLYSTYLEDGVFNSKGSSVEEYVVFDTADDVNPLHFEMNIVDGVFYYETSVLVGVLSESYNMDPTTGNICMRVVWKVDNALGEVIEPDKYVSYHIVDVNDYDSSIYKGVVNKTTFNSTIGLIELNKDSLSSDEINTILGNNCLTIDEEKYVIAYKEYDYFDYFIYTSSIGGEVMITTIVDGDEVIKKSSKLTDDEKASLLARTISDPATLDSLNLYVEMLEYNSYQEFLTVKSQHETVSGYVSLGLECCILFYLKVEQVD